MFGRRYCVCDFHEMKHTPTIVVFIVFIIASANIQRNFVDANELQQAEQLGKIGIIFFFYPSDRKETHIHTKHIYTHCRPKKKKTNTDRKRETTNMNVLRSIKSERCMDMHAMILIYRKVYVLCSVY